MKKLIAILCLALTILTGCNKAHWSHEKCVEYIVERNNILSYDYTVKQINHNEKTSGNDEVYCFDITIISGDFNQRYCCFAVVSDGEVIYVDCDKWEE